ncbi:hypothetical protein GF325_14900 [Candidatus Bathyarchaeota archaeon]|nr:hypothetical protein [Candidatus Bathyarchaeota archaeon]
MDGEISFCGTAHVKAIAESCRVTRKVVLMCVSHRGLLGAILFGGSIEMTGKITDAVREMFTNGSWHEDQYEENPILSKGCTRDYFGEFKAFLPGELEHLAQEQGMEVIQVQGLGYAGLPV